MKGTLCEKKIGNAFNITVIMLRNEVITRLASHTTVLSCCILLYALQLVSDKCSFTLTTTVIETSKKEKGNKIVYL